MPSDDLTRRLERLITELAAADAPDVVAEARARARERARDILAETLTEQLLEHAAGEPGAPAPSPATPRRTPEPRRKAKARAESARKPEPVSRPEPEPEQGTGLYVYGVVADAPDGLTDGLASVVPDAGVRLLEGGGVQALVTDVPLSEYGEAALRENLNRMEWLQATAVAHETVLEQILGRAELIPFRLCTVFAGEASLVAMLEGERRTFRHTLGRIRGATEWGVKAVAGMPVEAPAGAGDGASEGGEGASYFAARREERERATQVRQLLGNVADEAHARLSEAARAATLHRAQSKELGGYEGRMVLNGSYLVDDDHAHAFGEMVGELDARYREVGVRFELTGPWPPYNFTDEVDAEPR